MKNAKSPLVRVGKVSRVTRAIVLAPLKEFGSETLGYPM
jgi:hypothetical protein